MSSLTHQELTALVLDELGIWEAQYNVEAIVGELDDSYHLTGPDATTGFYDIPEDELRAVCATYDLHNH